MKITRETYLACQQLLDEAKRKMEQIKEIEAELAAYLQVPDDGHEYFGHVSDAVYGNDDYKIKPLLSNLGHTYDNKPRKKRVN